jgi:phospholipid/cholesterol/gamma-HCH transport system ATP-binding protein
MNGTIRPDEGHVFIKDKDIYNISAEALSNIKKSFGMLFQYSALLDSMTVEENVALPLDEHTKLADEIIKIIIKIKLRCGLRARKILSSQISGGMRKRVGLAAAIALILTSVF